MTYIDLMRMHKKEYAEVEEKIPFLSGIEKLVAKYLTLRWIKGYKWEGGLGNSRSVNDAYERIMKLGFTFEQIDEELQRQITNIINARG